jgi:hypothetical protein
VAAVPTTDVVKRASVDGSHPAQRGKNVPLTTFLSEESQKHFVKNFGLIARVDEKLRRDHFATSPNLSKKTSIDDAVKRYKRQPNILKSTFFLADDNWLLNRANSENNKRVAFIYNNEQQMALQLKVNQRTVTIHKLTQKEVPRFKKDAIEIKKGEYILCESDEKKVRFYISGKWNPIKGDWLLYHCEQSRPLPAVNMLVKYLKWVVDGTGTPIKPVAEK